MSIISPFFSGKFDRSCSFAGELHFHSPYNNFVSEQNTFYKSLTIPEGSRPCTNRPSPPWSLDTHFPPAGPSPQPEGMPSPSPRTKIHHSPARSPFLSSRCFKIFQLFSLLFSENPWESVTLLLPLPLPAVIGLPHLPTPTGILLPHFHAEILNF